MLGLPQHGCVHQWTCEDNNPCTIEVCVNGACHNQLICPEDTLCINYCCVVVSATSAYCGQDAYAQQPGLVASEPDPVTCPGTTITVHRNLCNLGICPETFTWSIEASIKGTDVMVTPQKPFPEVLVQPSPACQVLTASVMIGPDFAGMFELHWTATSTSDGTCGPVVTLTATATSTVTVVRVDLDVDSDNTNGDPDYGPQRNQAEEDIEDSPDLPGKYLCVNDDDDDDDGVLERDDGYNLCPLDPADDINSAEDDFVRMVFEVPAPINLSVARIRVTAPSSGNVRIWTRNGNQARQLVSVAQGGDWVPSGTYLPGDLGLSVLTRTVNLWLEGLSPSGATNDRILFEVDPNGANDFLCAEAVRVRVLDLRFINDSNAVIPAVGQDAHLDVSNQKTDENLPATATFDGPSTGDPDNFRFSIRGLGSALTPKVRLRATSGGATTYTHDFDTVEGAGPEYRISQHVRLVSNETDDAYLGHQTVRVKIGDELNAELVLGGTTLCTAKLPVCRPPLETNHHAIRTVHNHFVIVDIPGTMVAANTDVAVTTTRMSEAWAQCCVRFVSAAKIKIPVKNVLRVRGASTGAGTISVTVDGVPVGPVTIGTGQSAYQVAQSLAAAINGAIGAGTASGFNTIPLQNLAHMVAKKGMNVTYTGLAQTVPGILVKIPDLKFTDGIEQLDEEPALAANYGDGDPNTIDVFVVDNLSSGNRGDAWPACSGGVGAATDMLNTAFVVLSAADAPGDNPHTTAHEAGRFILNYCDLEVDPLNLISATSGVDSIGAAKRLTDVQCETARNTSDGTLLRSE